MLGLLSVGTSLGIVVLGSERSHRGVLRRRHATPDVTHGVRDSGAGDGAAAGTALVEPQVLAVLNDVPAP